MEKNNKILYISSANPTKGPGVIAMDHFNALKQGGFDVDFLTLHKVDAIPDIKYIYSKKRTKWHNYKYKLFKKFAKYDTSNNHCFFFLKDTDPPVPAKRVIKNISNDYDMIIIYFWQELLSYKSILEIYKHCKKRPKVIFICADYSTMTGGCHFLGDCENYKTGCGKCPMIFSNNPNDFTALNVKYREKVINEIRPYVRVNSYMNKFFKQAKVMQAGAKIITSYPLINQDIFKPLDKKLCRKEYGIRDDNKFIILFGCQDLNDPRKGMTHLIDSLNLFYDKLTDDERKNILLISIGRDSELINKTIKFERKHLGLVDFYNLPQIYSLADIFLSPSVNDAGPSMVNQSIACGTPVVAFEIGTALDIVKNQGTGYAVPLRNSIAFSEAIERIYRMDKEDYLELRYRCKEVSDKLQSFSAFISFFKNL